MNGRSWDGVGLEKINMPEAMACHYVPKVRAREEGVIYGADGAEPGFVSKLLPRSKSCCPFNKSQYKSPVAPKALTQKVYGTLPNLNSNPVRPAISLLQPLLCLVPLPLLCLVPQPLLCLVPLPLLCLVPLPLLCLVPLPLLCLVG